jgi:hypothetical protein
MDSKELEAQLAEAKESTSKKMEQKDETIAFMQTEMMRIMKEKRLEERQRARSELESQHAIVSSQLDPYKANEDNIERFENAFAEKRAAYEQQGQQSRRNLTQLQEYLQQEKHKNQHLVKQKSPQN